MNKWFNEVFLASIFDQVGSGKQKWLSAKQTNVCVKYMDKQTVYFEADGYGNKYKHDNYTCEWQGREVHLWYSKKNGCGCIEFGYNKEEVAILIAEAEAEHARIIRERIERIKKKPERLDKKIKELTKRIEQYELEYQYDVEGGFTEDAEFDLERIAELKAELALYI